MKLIHVKMMAIATALVWLWQLGMQIYFVGYQLTHRVFLNDPMIGAFARRNLVTSSMQMLGFVGLGIGFASVVLWRKSGWAAIGLAILSALVLWCWELSALSLFFRPPLGDGSTVRAMLGWWKFSTASANNILALFRDIFLVASIPFWSFSYDALKAESDATANSEK